MKKSSFDSFFNPFSHLKENVLSPWSRIFRSSLEEKIMDTFLVFSGNRFSRLGIFDYLTVGIPLGLYWILHSLDEELKYGHYIGNNFLTVCVYFVFLLINLPFLATRYAFAFMATLLSLPLVAIVHFSVSFFLGGNRLRSEALDLQNDSGKTLQEFFTEQRVNFKDFRIKLASNPNIRQETVMVLKRKHHLTSDSRPEIVFQAPLSGNSKQKKALRAIYELNEGQFARYLSQEKQAHQFSVFSIACSQNFTADNAHQVVEFSPGKKG